MSGFLTRPKRAGTTKDKSVRQERRLAQQLGGRTTPGSGAGFLKGDVFIPGDGVVLGQRAEMIEAKTTKFRSMTIKQEWLEQLEREASAEGKRPVLIIEMDNEATQAFRPREYVLLPLRDYEDLKDAKNTGA